MSTYLINIVANSDFAAVITRDTEALNGNTAALEANTAAVAQNGVVVGGAEASRKKLRGETEAGEKATMTLFDRIKQLDNAFLKLSGTQNTVGYNFMGLSIRVGYLVIPVLIGLLGVVLQVAAGFIAMAAAAGVAALAVLSVAGLGVAVLSHRMKGNEMNQPEGFAQGSQTIWSMLFKPIWDTLDNPRLQGVVENATLFVKTLFGDTIPKALEAFLSHIDPGTMMVIEQLFMRWLPNAAGALTAWGSRVFNLIGESTLSRLSAFMSYLAGGIENVAVWLATGGWESMDNVTRLIGDIISTIIDLGRSALPTLVGVLNSVWPFPVKYMMEAIITFLDQLSERSEAIDVLAKTSIVLATLVAGVLIVQMAATVFAAVFSQTGLIIMGIILAAAALYVAIGIFWDVMSLIGNAIIMVSQLIYDIIISALETLLVGIWNLLTGDDRQPTHRVKSQEEYWKMLTEPGGRTSDAWWGPGKAFVAGAKGLWEAGSNTLRVVFDPGFVDEHAMKEANRETGVSWEVANSQFSRGAYA